MPRPPKYVTRADLGWGATAARAANPRSGLVVHYDSADQNLAGKDHSACVAYWRRTRAFHTGPARGWVDVGYSFMACPHSYVLEGRGLGREQAAQPGGNFSHYSVTLATGSNDRITPEQIEAVRQLRQWLMEDHQVSGKVLGHRDFIATSCPGDRAYALIKDGTFTQAPGAITTTEDDLLGLKKGDSGERVKLLQLMLKTIGGEVAAALLYPGGPKDGVDSDYGDSVAEAVRLARESVGSKALKGYGDKMTPDAVEQVHRAYARTQALRAVSGLPGGGGGAVDLEGATLTAKITGVK